VSIHLGKDRKIQISYKKPTKERKLSNNVSDIRHSHLIQTTSSTNLRITMYEDYLTIIN